ncbi:MAG: restriction endonuclease [Alphaproteobacteria bacterium]|nr:MAG: restriction endonuclease [Alphaproteobacteria bacterium]
MTPGPSAAASLISDYMDVEGPPVHVTDLLANIVSSRGWAAADDVAEKAVGWSSKFLFQLTRTESLERQRGSFVVYTFNSSDPEYVQGSCFCEPTDDQQTVEAKKRRARTLPIAREFEALTPTDFEKLCGGVLRLFGVSDPQVSRRSADQGIDFYGSAPFAKVLAEEKLPAGVEKDLRVWIVGQAKHYSAVKVSTKDLRELVGSTELARAKIFAGSKDPLDEFTARLCDPVFYMLITSGVFTRDSHDLIGRSGIIALDQMQLAQLLADNGVGTAADLITSGDLTSWLDGEPAIDVSGGEETGVSN